VPLDADYDSGKSRAILTDRGPSGKIAHKGRGGTQVTLSVLVKAFAESPTSMIFLGTREHGSGLSCPSLLPLIGAGSRAQGMCSRSAAAR